MVELEDLYAMEGIESQFERLNKFCEGFGSIVERFSAGELQRNTPLMGAESFTVAIFKANGFQWDISSGFENFITDGLKKAYDFIVGLLKDIWNFFFGSTKLALETKNNIKVSKDLFVNIKKTGSDRFNKLAEIYFPIAKDIAGLVDDVAAIDEVLKTYEDYTGQQPPGKELTDIKVSFLHLADEMKKNVSDMNASSFIKTLSVHWFDQIGQMLNDYEHLLSEVKKMMDSDKAKNAAKETETEKGKLANKFILACTKLTKMSSEGLKRICAAQQKAVIELNKLKEAGKQ